VAISDATGLTSGAQRSRGIEPVLDRSHEIQCDDVVDTDIDALAAAHGEAAAVVAHRRRNVARRVGCAAHFTGAKQRPEHKCLARPAGECGEQSNGARRQHGDCGDAARALPRPGCQGGGRGFRLLWIEHASAGCLRHALGLDGRAPHRAVKTHDDDAVGPVQVDDARCHLQPADRRRERAEIVDRPRLEYDGCGRGRQGVESKRELGDDGERAERTGEQLRDVEAGDGRRGERDRVDPGEEREVLIDDAFTLAVVGATDAYATGLLPGFILFGIGITAIGVAAQVGATSRVANNDAGAASGVLNSGYQVGGALGLAVITTLTTTHITDALKSGTGQVSAAVGGYDYGLLIAAVFAAANIVIAIVSPSTRVSQPEATLAAELEPVVA